MHGHISHVSIIGASLAATVFFLVSVFGVIFVIRKRRRKHSLMSNGNTTELRDKFPDHGTFTAPPMQEIDANSLYGTLEVPNTGIMELRDGMSILELEDSPKPIRHELMANQDPTGHTMIQDQSSRKRFAVYVSTERSRETWPLIGTSSDKPGVETIVSASTIRKVPDLNQSLSPTPISESPQIWPVVAGFNRHPSTSGPGVQIGSNTASTVNSISVKVDEVSTRTTLVHVSKALGRNDHIPSSPTFMDIEITIPPGEQRALAMDTSPSYDEDIIESYNFF